MTSPALCGVTMLHGITQAADSKDEKQQFHEEKTLVLKDWGQCCTKFGNLTWTKSDN